MKLKEFKKNYPVCPYCSSTNFKQMDGRGQDVICKDCWGGEFGCQFWFENATDDAYFRGFRFWNGTHEAWFHILPSGMMVRVLIVDQGPISDNPIENRLRFKTTTRPREMWKFFNKDYALSWLNKKTKNILKSGNKLIK